MLTQFVVGAACRSCLPLLAVDVGDVGGRCRCLLQLVVDVVCGGWLLQLEVVVVGCRCQLEHDLQHDSAGHPV